jgi:hypothetical protein
MNFYIGGEFGISTDLFLQSVVAQDKRPYGREYHLYTDTGRSAIYIALQEIIRRGGAKVAWLPRYCCESVILPFRLLEFTINFYSMGKNLESPDRLPASMASATFLFIHYFGRKNYTVMNWLKALLPKDRPLFIIEDCVQAALNGNIGNYGDFAIASYRKFLPQPDGALLACDVPISDEMLSESDENFVSERLIAKIVREGGGKSEIFLELLAMAEERIHNVIIPRKMSLLSCFLFHRIDLEEVKRLRKANWEYLSGTLKAESLSNEKLLPLYEAMEEDEIPLGFPILLNKSIRDDFRQFLTSHSIFCPVHWAHREEYGESDWGCERELSASMLTLPIDQRLAEPALDYMIDKIKIFLKR